MKNFLCTGYCTLDEERVNCIAKDSSYMAYSIIEYRNMLQLGNDSYLKI